MLALLWAFRGPIAIVAAVLALLGTWIWHGHEKYQEGLKVGNEKFKKEQMAHQQDRTDWEATVTTWQAQVKTQQDELAKAKKEKEDIVAKNLDEYNKLKAQQVVKRSKIENEIKLNFKPTDVVVVPSEFVRLHNEAVGSTPTPEGNVEKFSISKNRSESTGKVQTFDATSFAEVVLGNVNEYKTLALRCDKLVDVVTKLEDTYGRTNIGGFDLQTVPDGRDVLSGVAANQLF
jgi:hypothetical protein